MSRPVRRILVILREHVGDIVNSTPYIRALQAKYPEAQFVVDVGAPAAGVLEHFPGLEALWQRPTHEGALGKLKYVWKLRRGRFDMAVILDDSSRFVLEAWLAGIPARAGVFRKRFQSFFTTWVPYSREKHDLFDPFNELMRELDVPVGVSRPVLFPSPNDLELVSALLGQVLERGKGLVGLNPSTGRHYNRWPSDRWAEVADWLTEEGYVCVLLGSPKDLEFNAEIGAWSESKPLDWAGKVSLVQLYEVCKKLKYMVSIDTGTVHIGAAAGTPTVILYGPTDPKRFYPYGDRWEVVRQPDKLMASNPTADVKAAFRALRKRFP